jgi:cytosine/adenosine deaminase-related metal-dependent hydrolase
MLGWATLNGARALQMEAGLGSFEKGKKPGLVLIKGADTNGLLSKASTAQRII